MSDENPPAFLRLFIAVPVPTEVRAQIERAQSQWRRSLPPGSVRWGKPEQFHVTLKFLGDQLAANLAELQHAVSAVAKTVSPFPLAAAGLGCFPNAHRPRVMWVGVQDPDNRLVELHRKISLATRPFEPADQSERFVGHITLGRFKPGNPAAQKTFQKQLGKIPLKTYGIWTADRLAIIRCELLADGVRHSALAECPFGEETMKPF